MTEIIKSQNDKREYKLFQLDNKMRCLIISDQDADISAAALDVNVGSTLDKKPLYGTAHFLEHMLFMGSEKYPSENEYAKYISDNGGYSNAWTSNTNTNYQFQVSKEGFSGALDRFAQFFICPLLGDSSVDREIEAVNSEFQQSLQHDGWHFYNLLQQISNENSYLNHFSCGNKDTLKQEGIREALLDFHKKFYSSNIMTLVVLDSQPIIKLEQEIISLFSQVKNFDVQIPDLSQPACYDEKNTNQIIKFVPVKNKDIMSLVWQLPYVEKEFETQPLQMLVELFGHEGQNSLLSFLIKEDLATALSSSQDHELNCMSFFQIDIDLTLKGMKNWEQVLQTVYQYANIVANKTPQESFFNEIRDLGKIKFRFAEKKDPFQYVTGLSSQMQLFDKFDQLQYLIQKSYFPTKFDSERIQIMLNKVKEFENFNLFIRSQNYDGKLSKKEKWMNTQYDIESAQSIIQKMKTQSIENSLLELPPKNIYIPQDFSILPGNEQLSEKPILTKLDDIDLWYQKDDKFENPKGFFTLKYLTNENNFGRSIRSVVFKNIWQEVVQEYLREDQYMAGLASMRFNLSFLQDGVNFSFSGYNDSLFKFVIETFKIIKDICQSDKSKLQKIFNQSKEYKDQYYQNLQLEQTYQQAIKMISVIIQEFNYESHTLKDYLINYNFNDFQTDLNNWMNNGHFIAFSYGNITLQQSIEISGKVQQILKTDKICKTQLHPVRLLTLNGHFAYEKELIDEKNENSCSVVLFQLGLCNLIDNLLLKMVMQYMDEPCFNQLRTLEQLGYVVWSFQQVNRNVMQAQILVQSQRFSSEYLIERIDLFLSDIRQKIKELSDEDFKLIVQAVLVDIKQKDINMQQHFDRFWGEINKHQYCFDRKQQQIQMIENITKNQFQSFFENGFFNQIKRIDLQLNAKSHSQELNELKEKSQSSKIRIKNSLAHWKFNQSLWPDQILANLLEK